MNFDIAFEKVIGHEGGYVNHPLDPGTETKYGISQRTYPDEDIRNLTVVRAKDIYRKDFWDRAQCDKMPPAVAYAVFDAAINSGISQSVKFLQRALGVQDDGKVGAQTLAVIDKTDSEALLARFLGHRLAFMTNLGTWPTFGKGWARRIADQLKGV